MAILQLEPPEWRRRMQGGYKKITIFEQILRFISEPMQDRAIVTMESK